MTPVNLAVLINTFDELELQRVPYVWGGKVHPLTRPATEVGGVDCSGFAQYAVAQSTNQGLLLPEGSWEQRDFFEGQDLHKPLYKDAGTLADANRLFICFIKPGNGHAGHVWFLNDGHTMESYGHHGVGSRHWDTPVLQRRVAAIFEIPTVTGM